MRISDWSSDVCSSDLLPGDDRNELNGARAGADHRDVLAGEVIRMVPVRGVECAAAELFAAVDRRIGRSMQLADRQRSEEHTSELQSLMRISYAVFCLKKKNKNKII